MTYLLDIIGFVGSLMLLVHAIRKGVSQDWRLRGQVLLSLVGIAYVSLHLYVAAHKEVIRAARRTIILFYSAEGALVGAFVGIFTTLCLAGWFTDILGNNREAQLQEISRARPR